jgi:hypothetical protein
LRLAAAACAPMLATRAPSVHPSTAPNTPPRHAPPRTLLSAPAAQRRRRQAPPPAPAATPAAGPQARAPPRCRARPGIPAAAAAAPRPAAPPCSWRWRGPRPGVSGWVGVCSNATASLLRDDCCTPQCLETRSTPHPDVKGDGCASSDLQVHAEAQRAAAGKLGTQAVLQHIAASPARQHAVHRRVGALTWRVHPYVWRGKGWLHGARLSALPATTARRRTSSGRR